MSDSALINLAKKQGGVLSAKDYRTLKNSNNTKTAKKDSNKQSEKYNFHFKLEIEKLNDYEYKFILSGRHYSTNDVNGWLSFGKRNAYKNAVKQAFKDYFLINKKVKPKIQFDKSVMYSVSYNRLSRDDDGNRITLKPFRDMLTEYGFIKDDSRKHLFEMPNFEILSSVYKTEIYLKKIDQIPTMAEILNNTNFFINFMLK